jgi:hypothetical protein
MPRATQFGLVRSYRVRAKEKNRGGGGRFTKREGKDCERNVPIKVVGVPGQEYLRENCSELAAIQADMNPCGMNVATWLQQYHLDDSRCYFCLSDVNCELGRRTNYTLCLKCRSSSDPTQGWWGPNANKIVIPTNGVRDDQSSDDDDVFLAEGLSVQDSLTGPEVSARLIGNGSRLKPAKRGRGLVSVDNQTGYFKYEPKAVTLRAKSQRNQFNYNRKKKRNSRRLHTTYLCLS